MIVWLYIVFFGYWVLRTYRNYGINLSFYILAIYLFSGVCCVALFTFYPDSIRYPYRVTALPIVLMCCLLWLCLYPLVRFGNSLSVEAITVEQKQLDRFAWCVIVPALASMLVSATMLAAVFKYGNFFKARMAFEEGHLENAVTEKLGLFGYFVSLGPSLSMVALILAFYYFFYLRRTGIITVLLFVASLCIVVNNLAIAGREGMVRWGIFIVMASVLFRKYMTYHEHKKFWLTVGIVAVVIIGLFAWITIDRFTERPNDRGPLYSMLYYIGEQPYYFAYGYERFGDQPMTGTIGSLFPIVSGHQFDIFKLNSRYYADYFLNTFPTIVGDFVNHAGTGKALLVCLCIWVAGMFGFWKLRPNQPLKLGKLVAFLFYYEVMLLGVFYFLHYPRFTQFTLIFYVGLAWMFARMGRGQEDVGMLETGEEDDQEEDQEEEVVQ